jgi:hypothetical protein
MAEEKKTTSIKTIKDYFGFREGDSMKDFAAEMKGLSQEDKEQLCEGIENGSLTY